MKHMILMLALLLGGCAIEPLQIRVVERVSVSTEGYSYPRRHVARERRCYDCDRRIVRDDRRHRSHRQDRRHRHNQACGHATRSGGEPREKQRIKARPVRVERNVKRCEDPGRCVGRRSERHSSRRQRLLH